MGETRTLDDCLMYRLFGILRQQGWWSRRTGVEMTKISVIEDSDEVLPNTYVMKTPRPFVFFKDDLTLNTGSITVYANNIVMNSGGYSIDWRQGRIILDNDPDGATITIDADIYSVDVVEGYPEDKILERLDLPIIAFNVENQDDRPFGIGMSLTKFRKRFVSIDMLCRHSGEVKDIFDDLIKFIVCIPHMNLDDHKPLTPENDLDSAWNFADQQSGYYVVQQVQGDLIKPRTTGSPKERYRALITFETERVS